MGYAGAEEEEEEEHTGCAAAAAVKKGKKAVTYGSVCAGDGNTEALKIRFDASQVTVEELLEVFFASHDATARTATAQYESAIWPQSEEQAEKVKAYVERLNEKTRGRPIATKIRNPNKTRFAKAERYHQNYNRKNAYRLMAAFGVFLLNVQAPNSFLFQEQLKTLLGAGVVLSSLEQMLPFYDRVLDELEGTLTSSSSSTTDEGDNRSR